MSESLALWSIDLFLKGKGKTVGEKFEEQAALSHDVLAKQDIKTKRPFRAKEPEKAPAKRIARKVSKKTDIQTDRKF